MATSIFTIVVALLGIITWFLKWKYDLKLQMQRELEEIPFRVNEAERLRDEGLKNNNSDLLTTANSNLKQLRDRKKYLLQRLGQNTVG